MFKDSQRSFRARGGAFLHDRIAHSLARCRSRDRVSLQSKKTSQLILYRGECKKLSFKKPSLKPRFTTRLSLLSLKLEHSADDTHLKTQGVFPRSGGAAFDVQRLLAPLSRVLALDGESIDSSISSPKVYQSGFKSC